MALDGAYLHFIAHEIESIIGARVDKVFQPSKEELVIVFRAKSGNVRLLISADASSPRLHFTELTLENPASPPMFCMLMRKHIGSGRLIKVEQSGMDRVLTLYFEGINELGDLAVSRLVIEIMGRHSNIILVNEKGTVVDSIKRVPNDISSVRMIIPGITYTTPPPQDKLNLLNADIDEVMARFSETHASDISKALMTVIEGLSPLLSREISHLATKGQDISKESMSDFYKERLKNELIALRERLASCEGDFTVVVDDSKKIRDFTFMDIAQYGVSIEKTKYSSACALIDSFYANRDRVSRMKQRSHDLLKLLMNTYERIEKKLSLQKQELLECADRDKLRVFGDLINSNLYRIEKGQGSVTLENFYEEGSPEVKIKLDKRLTPQQNAQKYYSEYKKAATAEAILGELMEKSRQELIYIDSVFDAVSRTEGESELLEIRQELAEQGYIRLPKAKQNKMLKAQPPIKYMSEDGFSILCGRNNKQNDKLSMKYAKNQDLWLHTQGIAGSHVIIESEGKEISDLAITQAAMIAAYNSKGRDSAQVAVDYTYIKHVKKPNGAKPGMVIFTDYYTAYVTPDSKKVESLRVK